MAGELMITCAAREACHFSLQSAHWGPALHSPAMAGTEPLRGGSLPPAPYLAWSPAHTHPVPRPTPPFLPWGSAAHCPDSVSPVHLLPLLCSSLRFPHHSLLLQEASSGHPACRELSCSQDPIAVLPLTVSQSLIWHRQALSLCWVLGVWRQVPTGSSAGGETSADR